MIHGEAGTMLFGDRNLIQTTVNYMKNFYLTRNSPVVYEALPCDRVRPRAGTQDGTALRPSLQSGNRHCGQDTLVERMIQQFEWVCRRIVASHWRYRRQIWTRFR